MFESKDIRLNSYSLIVVHFKRSHVLPLFRLFFLLIGNLKAGLRNIYLEAQQRV